VGHYLETVMTRAEIEAQLRSDYADGIPVQVGDQTKTFPPGSPGYEHRIAEMTDALVAVEAAVVVEAAEEAQRALAKTAYSALKAGTATAAQTQRVVAWLLREQVRELQEEFPA